MRRACVTLLAPFALLVLVGCGDDEPSSSGPSSSSTSSAGAVVTASSGASTVGVGGAGGDDGEGGAALPDVFEVSGIVTDGEAALAGASVLQGGGDVQVVTGADGAFTIAMRGDQPGIPTLVAGKIGHRSAGQEIYEVPRAPIEIVLHAAAPPDNEAYFYGEPGDGDPGHDVSTAFCGHCHATFATTFQESAHARATRDPWVQDLYAGVATARGTGTACDAIDGAWRAGTRPGDPGSGELRCYVGDGVLPDLNDCGGPGDVACDDVAVDDLLEAFGGCADCHAAGMDGPAGGRDLLDAEGVAFDSGNHCDACHHVADIDLDAPPGTAGRLVVQRPGERVSSAPASPLRQVMYGPLLDVPNPFMGGSPQPRFTEAVFCAGCHEQAQDALLPGRELDPQRWPDGLPTHSTFSEWQTSDYAEAGVPCQGCHMPAIPGMFNSVDIATADGAGISDGFGRSPERNRSHAFLGALEGSPRMLDRALTLSIDATAAASSLEVEVGIRNEGAGHAVPTGEPLRSLLLVLEVEACGERAAATAGGSIGIGAGALAATTVGTDVAAGDTSAIAWPDAAAVAAVGQVVRVVRDEGELLDYPGIGSFVGLPASEKGKPILVPRGEATIVSIAGDALTLDRALELFDGDRLVVGEPLAPDLEGAPASALAGHPGRDFQRLMQDDDGRIDVPHYRASRIVSDDRIPPSGAVSSTHAFAIPDGCAELTVRATLLYRRAPFALARERGWDLREHVAARRELIVAADR